MAPVKFFGKRAQFPRVGAWAVTISPPDKLGVLFEVKDTEVELHLVDEKGETTETVKTSPSNVRMATYDEITHLTRTSHLSAFDAAVMGYAITEEQVKALSALQRKVLGKSLDDADAAQGLIEESQEQLKMLQAAKLAAHPEAVALEAQIEEERQAFVASVEKRRTDLAAKLTKKE
jgi:signal transduction histidine kinase